MATALTGAEKIGEIVTSFPKASNIFKSYQIDFCCGGNRVLSTVIRQQGLNEDEVLGKLNEVCQEAASLKEADMDWAKAASPDLIDFVVNAHHVYLRKELPLLSEFVTKILTVHGPNHGEVLSKLHKLFHTLKMELEQHLIKEEQMIFPLIKEYEQNPSDALRGKISQVIEELESEHTTAGDLLKEMRAVTDQYKLPEDACRTYTLTFLKLEELESDLFQHIHLENNILFPRYL